MTNHELLVLFGGLLLGMLGAFLVWLWTAKVYIPKFSVSRISKKASEDNAAGFRYRVKVLNTGRRNASDLTLSCRLVIQGLDPTAPTNYTSIRLPVADEHPFPILEGGEGRIYSLRIAELESVDLDRLPDDFAARVTAGLVTLEEILKLPNITTAFVRFAVAGSHEVGGLRRAIHRRYHLADIIEGGFEDRHSTVIVSLTDQCRFPGYTKSSKRSGESGGYLTRE